MRKKKAKKKAKWEYATSGPTRMRGRKDEGGVEYQQVSRTYKREDVDKAVRKIDKRLKTK